MQVFLFSKCYNKKLLDLWVQLIENYKSVIDCQKKLIENQDYIIQNQDESIASFTASQEKEDFNDSF